MIENILGNIDGGKILDVATQEGGFVQILIEYLKSYSEIIGIDISEPAIEAARKNLAHERIQFRVMDAEAMEFEDQSFDTVNISASLHHIAHIPRVLDEMKRVLRVGGRFLVFEMHRDGLTEPELTSVYLHHWVAETDTALGFLHHPTLPRQAIVDQVTRLELRQVQDYDHRDQDSDPMESTRIAQLEDLIIRNTQRAKSAENYAQLKAQGKTLLQRLHKVGARNEPRLMMVGEK